MRSITSAKVRSSSSGKGALAGAAGAAAGATGGRVTAAGSAALAKGAAIINARASMERRDECSMSNELLILFDRRRANRGTIVQGR
jgi:hypothetical protein